MLSGGARPSPLALSNWIPSLVLGNGTLPRGLPEKRQAPLTPCLPGHIPPLTGFIPAPLCTPVQPPRPPTSAGASALAPAPRLASSTLGSGQSWVLETNPSPSAPRVSLLGHHKLWGPASALSSPPSRSQWLSPNWTNWLVLTATSFYSAYKTSGFSFSALVTILN